MKPRGKKDVDFIWDIDCQKGLQNPKSLTQPDFSKSFVLYTDSSNKAIGFVLMQEHDNVLKPITYGGRVLTETECRYATIDRELLAIYFAVKKNEVYILNHTCIIYTDHKPLVSLKSFKDVVNKRYRWILYLETLGVSLRYVKGRKNILADFVSRNVKDKDDKLDIIKHCPVQFIDDVFESSDLLLQQRKDENLSKIIKSAQGDKKIYRRNLKDVSII